MSKNKISKVVISVVSLLLVFLCIAFFTKPSKAPNVPVDVHVPAEPVESRVSFVGVGDNLIHDAVYIGANRHAGGDGINLNIFDFKPMYEGVREIISAADIAYINQETIPGGDELGISSYPLFNSPQQLIYDMKDIGFDVFSQATNHTFDKGAKGVENAYNLYKSLEDEITCVGLYKKGERNFKMIEKNGIKIGMVNFTDLTNGLSLPASCEYYAPLMENEAQIVEDIKYAKENSDFVIAFVHWGNEYQYEPSARQRHQAQLFADNGTDIVIGTHPHVIQPVEYVGETLVAFSLGNFLSAQLDKGNMVEGMISFELVKKGEEKKVENVQFTPLVNHYSQRFRDISVYTLKDYRVNGKNGTHRLGMTADYVEKLVWQVIDPIFIND